MDGNAITLDDGTPQVERTALEPGAFGAIYDEYFSRVYNYVRYRVADATEAEDIVSEVFHRAIAGAGSYDPCRGPFPAWLFGIARNAVRDHRRRTRRWRILPLETLRGRAARMPLPDEGMISNDAHVRLCAALRSLANRERDVLGLRFGAGLRNREAAGILGLKPSQVAVLVYRALRKLRAQLGEEEESCR